MSSPIGQEESDWVFEKRRDVVDEFRLKVGKFDGSPEHSSDTSRTPYWFSGAWTSTGCNACLDIGTCV